MPAMMRRRPGGPIGARSAADAAHKAPEQEMGGEDGATRKPRRVITLPEKFTRGGMANMQVVRKRAVPKMPERGGMRVPTVPGRRAMADEYLKKMKQRGMA